jgi:four helix bundle protein
MRPQSLGSGLWVVANNKLSDIPDGMRFAEANGLISGGSKMRDYEQLRVWTSAHQSALEIHRISLTFPRSEMFALTSQIRRSAFSVPANIAEGCERNSNLDFARFLDIAMGSAKETDYHLLCSRDLGYVSLDLYQNIKSDLIRIQKMLTTLINTIRPRQH